MRKLSRPGVAVLTALAPATALAVAIPAIILSIPKVNKLDKYIERYTQLYNKVWSDFQNGISYGKIDVLGKDMKGTCVIDETTYVLNNILYQSPWGNYTSVIGYFINPQNNDETATINIIPYYEPQDMKQNLEELQKQYPNCSYEINEDNLVYTFRDEDNKIVESTSINKYGYIDHMSHTIYGVDLEMSLSYNSTPHSLNSTRKDFMDRYAKIYETYMSNMSKHYAYDNNDLTKGNISGNYQDESHFIYEPVKIVSDFSEKTIECTFVDAIRRVGTSRSIAITSTAEELNEKLIALEQKYPNFTYQVANGAIGYEFKDDNDNIATSLYINSDGYTLLTEAKGDKFFGVESLSMSYDTKPHLVEE